MPPLLQRRVDSLWESARANLRCDKSLAPVAFVGNEEAIHIVPLKMADDREKDLSACAIRALARATNATMVIFLSEAWVKRFTPAEAHRWQHSENKLMPTQMPDRREAVMMMVDTVEGRWQLYGDITRVDGKVDVEKPTVTNADNSEGRFCNLLPRKKEA